MRLLIAKHMVCGASREASHRHAFLWRWKMVRRVLMSVGE